MIELQCDQMGKLFVQYLVIYNIENLPNSKNISKFRFKRLAITEWTIKRLPKISFFAKYGHTAELAQKYLVSHTALIFLSSIHTL